MVKSRLLTAAVLAAFALATPFAASAQEATGLAATAPKEIVPATPLPDVPRNQTVVLGWGVAASSPRIISCGPPAAGGR